jgi:lipid biosynthesis B12-binding/radical SAM protein
MKWKRAHTDNITREKDAPLPTGKKMSKILMISSNTFAYPYPVYPLGMAMISATLAENGHTVHQFDYFAEGRSDDKLKEAILKFSPDYVGISIRNIDDVDSLSSNTGVLSTERNIVNIVRENTKAPVIAGGSALSILPHEILDFIGADYGIVGAGENIILALIESLDKNAPFPRLSGNNKLQPEEINTLPPMWDKTMVEFYLSKSGMLNLQTKKGCPYKCSYCVYPSLEGNRFKFRDPDAVIEDLERASMVYNVDTFFFTDSVFNDPDGRYLTLAEKIIASGIKIRWAGYFRPKNVRKEDLRLLKRSGLYAVEVGSDAATDTTLHAMSKGFTFDDVREFYDACILEEISSAYFFIFGGPGETEKTLTEGLMNLHELKDGVIFIYSGIRILPDTRIYYQAINEGILSKDDPLLTPVYYFSPHIDAKEINLLIEKEAGMNRRYIFPPDKGKMMADAMHAFGYNGLLWNELLAFSAKSQRKRRGHK